MHKNNLVNLNRVFTWFWVSGLAWWWSSCWTMSV